MANIKRKYQVKKLEGKATRRMATPLYQKDDKGEFILDDKNRKILAGGFEYTNKEVDAGYMIYLPSGSSFRLWTEEDVLAQGYRIGAKAGLVDMDTGDDVEEESEVDLEELVARKEKPRKTMESVKDD